MPALTLLVAVAAALPSQGDVRHAAYIGANGGICGERPCAADPNLAQVRRVRCRAADDGASCAYQIRTRGTARWERANDVFLRDPATGRWYLDDEDDDEAVRTRR